MLTRYAQSFHGQKLERQQHFRFIRQQKVDVRPGEFYQQIGIFKIGMEVLAFQNVKGKFQPHVANDHVEKLADPESSGFNCVGLLVHLLYLPFFFTAAGGGGGGGAGIIRFTDHCCAIPTKLLVSQYNTRPLEKL